MSNRFCVVQIELHPTGCEIGDVGGRGRGGRVGGGQDEVHQRTQGAHLVLGEVTGPAGRLGEGRQPLPQCRGPHQHGSPPQKCAAIVHVLSLPQLQNRLRVQRQWLWSYFTGQRSSRLIPEPPETDRHRS
ncbi:hypothetical protein B4Q13_21425 [Lacticaseibacillus rhamnosus]